jgi:hypothetical protein
MAQQCAREVLVDAEPGEEVRRDAGPTQLLHRVEPFVEELRARRVDRLALAAPEAVAGEAGHHLDPGDRDELLAGVPLYVLTPSLVRLPLAS